MIDSADRPKSRAELRRFGVVMATALGLLSALLWWQSRSAAPYVAAIGALFVLIAVVDARLLAPVERAWMRLAAVMSAVMTRVLLVSTYYLAVTPIGLIRRLMGHDTLGLRPDPNASTYWVPVESDGPATRPDKPY